MKPGIYSIGIFIFYSAFFHLKGQSIRQLGSGLQTPVECACLDSLGRFYAVSQNISGDSILVNRWDSSSQIWQKFASTDGSFKQGWKKSSCHFLKGELIIFGINGPFPFTGSIFKYNGNWSEIARMDFHSPYDYESEMKTYKFGNRIFIAGKYDSLAGKRGIVEFNGSSFKETGMYPSWLYRLYSFVSRNDSLFFSEGNNIHYFSGSDWTTIYNMGAFGNNELSMHKNIFHIYQQNQTTPLLMRLYPGGKKDSIPMNGIITPVFSSIRDRMLMSEKAPQPTRTLYSINSASKIQAHLRFRGQDSTPVYFLDNGSKVFAYSKTAIRHNGNNFGYVAELVPDSLKNVHKDTLHVKVFRDINRNGIIEGGERGYYSRVDETIEGNSYVTDSFGNLTIYPLDNEKIELAFGAEFNSPDCYKASFSGSVSNSVFNKIKTTETVLLPVWRTAASGTNIVLNAFSKSSARLDEASLLYFRLFNRDCNYAQHSVTLTVYLDSNASYIESLPEYTRKNGRELSFDITLTPGANEVYKEVVIAVQYPGAKYSLNQVVKNFGKVRTQTIEDTSDNIDSTMQVMVNSYDPNCKNSIPEGLITGELKKIRYIIEFQNEGNDDAWKVRVVDTLNLKMPVYEFRMVGASHPYTVSHIGTEITWTFDKIYLKPKSVSEEGSKGFLVFDAMVSGDLRKGDSIMNKAYIYFDYNKPIVTNNATVTRSDNWKSGPLYSGSVILSYPNPLSGNFFIENIDITDHRVFIYNSLGQLMGEYNINAASTHEIESQSWTSGVYILSNRKGGSQIIVKI